MADVIVPEDLRRLVHRVATAYGAAALARLLEVHPNTIRNWQRAPTVPPVWAIGRMAALAMERASAWSALASDLGDAAAGETPRRSGRRSVAGESQPDGDLERRSNG
jgi:hypothetical protein